MSLLGQSAIFLGAAVVAVPLSKRLGLGSVLGYLAAGIVIGPWVLGLIGDVESILHFAEFGVVLLLFLIGLELQPSRLWVMRKSVFGLGGAQVLLTGAALAVAGVLWGLSLATAIVAGLGLALSSTAFALQILAEKNQLTTRHGRAAFSILLFQDLAVIPILALVPLFGPDPEGLTGRGALVNAVTVIVVLAGIVVIGRYLLRQLLRLVARTRLREVFTAMALLTVIGTALLVETVGLSMALGAFLAGVLLADSEYRHELEANIEPFKGLLLGLFFIAVGMSVNLGLLVESPGRILVIVAMLMAAKALVLIPLARLFGLCDNRAAMSLAAVMSGGGEFAFVMFAIAARQRLIEAQLIDELILAVAVSMLLTPFIYMLNEAVGRKLERQEAPEYDEMDDPHNDVIIAGFGRVGQVVGRLLAVVGTPFTALEIDSSQVDVVRRYGNVVHFGDASRPDILRAAGAEHARVFVLAIDDVEASIRTAEAVRRHFPHLKIIARARNRRHAHWLMDLGIEHIFRETLLSSLSMSKRVLSKLGFGNDEVERIGEKFRARDIRLLKEQHAIHQSEEKMIQSAKDTAAELESLLQGDIKH